MSRILETFETLHRGLTVELIMTRRKDLVTCGPGQKAAAVLERNRAGNGARREIYDYLPVEDGDEIVGLFRTRRRDASPPTEDRVVETLMDSLSPKNLIGSDGTILDFLREVDDRPYRLVVSGNGISGLVTWSDLQKLPVRTALFGLITGLELEITRAIGRRYPQGEDWLMYLTPWAKKRVKRLINRAAKNDSAVDSLLFTVFWDKTSILRGIGCPGSWAESEYEEAFETIRKLRNEVAHARDYVASREDVERLQVTIHSLLSLRDQVAVWPPKDGIEVEP